MTKKGVRMTSMDRKGLSAARHGFTLAEILVAMAIFSVFIAVLMSSYITLVKAQRDADDYRIMYSEARRIMDKIVNDVRNNEILYAQKLTGVNVEESYKPGGSVMDQTLDELTLISKDGQKVASFYKETLGGTTGPNINNLVFSETDTKSGSSSCTSFNMNSDKIQIENFNVYISPKADPYSEQNIGNPSLQFQPSVTIFIKFKREGRAGDYTMDLQSTVSSRFYGKAVVIENPYNPVCAGSPPTP